MKKTIHAVFLVACAVAVLASAASVMAAGKDDGSLFLSKRGGGTVVSRSGTGQASLSKRFDRAFLDTQLVNYGHGTEPRYFVVFLVKDDYGEKSRPVLVGAEFTENMVFVRDADPDGPSWFDLSCRLEYGSVKSSLLTIHLRKGAGDLSGSAGLFGE